MSDLELALYGFAAFVMAIVSGMVGGGGGFVITPLGIFLGMTPAQAISTGKFNGLGVTVGALFGMKAIHGRVSKKRVLPIMALSFVIGLLVPYFIKSFESKAYRVTLGVMLLLMIPILIIKKIGIERRTPSTAQKISGGFILTLTLMLQGIFSGGIGALVNVVLMGMLGMTPLEANLTKRWSQLILNTVIIIGVLFSGLILWRVVIVGVSLTLIGSYIGGRIAVHRGDQFIMRIFIVFMLISAIALIVGA